ncbi:reverse transcriptase domain-containing protein [Paenibacillus herberti]|uniref:reverse transcriptase domain-containing protein n=1 Tax=Paenibacillus herberti TaxID=1619309 RepID=UPI00269CB7F0
MKRAQDHSGSIYEQNFLNLSYGFRPGRSCHNALKALNRSIEYERTSYIVDADIRSFFTNVNHQWLMKFLGVRVGDSNIQSLVRRFLKGGIMEQGLWEPTKTGIPQGSISNTCKSISALRPGLMV